MIEEGLEGISRAHGLPSLTMNDFYRAIVPYTTYVEPTQEELRSMKLRGTKHFRVPITSLVGMQFYVCRFGVAKYKRLIKSGKQKTPPVVSLRQGKYMLENGFHRVQAYHELGYKTVKVGISAWYA